MKTLFLALMIITNTILFAQNSMVGDGFGGRKWYKPYNYTVGSYSAYTICGEDKQLYGWGGNMSGQLGDGTLISSSLPVAALGMNHVKYYSTGYVMGAIKEDSTGWVWGNPYDHNNLFSIPIKVLDSVKFVDAGISSSVFVKYDGTVWSIGKNVYGEFGNGDSTNSFSNTPSKMLNISNAVRTAQGEKATTILLEDGSLMTAGKFNNSTYLTPTKIVINNFFVDIKANSWATIALDSTGKIWMWSSYSLPKELIDFNNIVAISGCNDGFHFLLLNENHECFAFGDNTHGQCGTNSGNSTNFAKVASNVNDIMAGEWFSYIVKSDGQLYASGSSEEGSIWLNIEDIERHEFTKVDPTISPMNLCGASNTGIYGNVNFPLPEIDTPIVFFPNAFSPNEDGKNDIFKAICYDKSKIENFNLKIVNRFGEILFNSNDIADGWKGKNTELSTYFYYCRYKQYNNKNYQEIKGDVIAVW